MFKNTGLHLYYDGCVVYLCQELPSIYTGLAPAILDWYGHCVRLIVSKQGGSGGIKIRHSEIAPEATFGPKKLLNTPHL